MEVEVEIECVGEYWVDVCWVDVYRFEVLRF